MRSKAISPEDWLQIAGNDISQRLRTEWLCSEPPARQVKVVAEGEEPDLDRFLGVLKIRDALIDVQSIEAQYSAATGEILAEWNMLGSFAQSLRYNAADYPCALLTFGMTLKVGRLASECSRTQALPSADYHELFSGCHDVYPLLRQRIWLRGSAGLP